MCEREGMGVKRSPERESSTAGLFLDCVSMSVCLSVTVCVCLRMGVC